ncbi:MAG: hypothetical protein ABSA63_06175 [Thermoplasmata archaeon]|jgi:hypothetical protein
MSRAPCTAGWVTGSLAVLVVLLVLSGSPPTLEPRASSHASPAALSLSGSVAEQGPRSVLLTATNSSVAAGVGIRFVLNVTPVNCAYAVAANVSVSSINIHLGDGFVFQALQPSIDTYANQCTASPWTLSVPLVYAYRSPGTKQVQAFVTWGDGSIVASNTVTVNVTGPTSINLGPLEAWFWGALAGTGVTLFACFLLRRRLPKSPSLPPQMV